MVAVVQMLLNQRDGEPFLDVDGWYGRNTRRAVINFQQSHGLPPRGVINAATWARLKQSHQRILDSVDATDPGILDHEDIRLVGGTPIVNYGMSGGSPVVVDRVVAQATNNSLVLLRFHGHGSPGHMIVSSGVLDTGSALAQEYGPKFFSYLRRLGPLFLDYGSIELNGCRVGQGRAGRLLLQGMANAIGVPVTAGIQSQYGGGSSTFRFEGPTRTICPYGQSLRSWAASKCGISQ